jgi:oligopeptide/dipeptide ABC transporter ATP-binding protein
VTVDQAALTVRDLRVTFGTPSGSIDAVRGVDLSIKPRRALVLLGESGSGKSATAHAILRLHGPEARVSGSVSLRGRDLTALDERAMEDVRGRYVSLVPQDPTGSLHPLRKVGAQIVEVLRRHAVETSRDARRLAAAELLERVGIPDPPRALRSYPFELSGGMRQRVAIALAIACRPDVLVADEPTTALDVTVQAQVLELFAGLQKELDMALLLVTHDVGVARVAGDDVAVMYAGRIVEIGPASDVLDRPAHPYTAGLLDAVPVPGIPRGHLRAIPGRPPGFDDGIGPGCALYPRCAHALDRCAQRTPPLVEVGPGHRAACDVVGGRAPRHAAAVGDARR